MNFHVLASIFFPRRCLACKMKLLSGILCGPCHSTINVARGAPRYPSGFPCPLGAAGSYENAALKTLIHALKFDGVRAVAQPLASILAIYAEPFKSYLNGCTVVPIPLSRERLRTRGFNQSELIANLFATRIGLPLRTDILVRVKHTKPQSETANLAERKENIRGCFSVIDTVLAEGRRFVLVDDVTTSGATFLEAARALQSARAEKIIALAVAQA